MSLFVSCAATLEPLLYQELIELGVSSLKIGYRGVYINQWDWATIYKVNYGSRLANRVLLPLLRFKCFNQNGLYRGASEFDWSKLLNNKLSFAIDANVHHRELRNSLFAAQVVKDAICDQMRERTGERPSVNPQEPDVQLNLYIDREMASLTFDTSGLPLNKRGYRIESVEAPMQETLAAAIVRLSEYKGDKLLLDPCCGSGTLLIEAALSATHTPPGYLRKEWGFMRHPEYDSISWLRVKNELDQHRIPLKSQTLMGLDINKTAIRVCKINLKAAGFLQNIEVIQRDFREFKPVIPPDFMVTNPPHGRRLEEEESLKPLYRALGDFMKQQCAKPSKGFIFTSSMELAKEVGLTTTKRHVLVSGGLDSRLLEYDIY